MDTANPPGVDMLFKMLLMGLTWLRLERPDILARRGVSIFGTLHAAQLISEGQRLSIPTNTKLISLIMLNCETIKVSRVPQRSRLLEMCANSKFPLIMIVKPARSAVQFDHVVGRGGYLLVVTALGMEMAAEAEAEFSELLDAASFEAAWQRYKARMGAIGAQARRARSRGDVRAPTGYHSLGAGASDAEIAARIRTAPNATALTEDDDW